MSLSFHSSVFSTRIDIDDLDNDGDVRICVDAESAIYLNRDEVKKVVECLHRQLGYVGTAEPIVTEDVETALCEAISEQYSAPGRTAPGIVVSKLSSPVGGGGSWYASVCTYNTQKTVVSHAYGSTRIEAIQKLSKAWLAKIAPPRTALDALLSVVK